MAGILAYQERATLILLIARLDNTIDHYQPIVVGLTLTRIEERPRVVCVVRTYFWVRTSVASCRSSRPSLTRSTRRGRESPRASSRQRTPCAERRLKVCPLNSAKIANVINSPRNSAKRGLSKQHLGCYRRCVVLYRLPGGACGPQAEQRTNQATLQMQMA